MKIGFFTDSYLPRIDGVATSVASCAKELERMGHEVYIIAPRYPGYKDRKNVIRLFSIRVNARPETRLGLQIPQRSLLKLLRIRFDIIHGHSGGPITFLGWQIAQLRNTPYVATYHTFWNRYAHYFLFLSAVIRPRVLEITSALFGNSCDVVIAPTEKVKEELQAYGVKKPIYTVPSGLVLENWGKAEKGYLRNKYKLKKTDKILLTVCRLGKEKSIEFILQSFKQIYSHDSSVYYCIVGDGPDYDKLIKFTTELGIANRVFFVGAILHKSIAKVYADADIFIYASQTETQGMVVIEAMASGLPVVALQDTVFKEVIENNYNGFVVEKNAKEFAQKVLLLLNNDKKRKEFAKNAKRSVQKFTVANTVKELLKVYDALLLDHVAEKRDWKDIVSRLNRDIVRLIKPANPRFARAQLNLKELTRFKETIKNYLIGE